MPPSIRPVTSSDATAIASLVESSFRHFVEPTWEDPARARFHGDSSPQAFEEMLSRAAFAAATYEADEPVGFIMMLRPTKINSLFVHPSRVRQGIGTALWVSARTFVRRHHPTITAVELNSSSHAYQFYRTLGFVPTADEQIKDGARFMPFSISLATPIGSPQNAAEVPFPSTSVIPFPFPLKAR